eukprot:756183-Hanusia_phi.AAC.3
MAMRCTMKTIQAMLHERLSAPPSSLLPAALDVSRQLCSQFRLSSSERSNEQALYPPVERRVCSRVALPASRS